MLGAGEGTRLQFLRGCEGGPGLASGPVLRRKGHPQTPAEGLTAPAVCPGFGWPWGTPATHYNSGLWNGKQGQSLEGWLHRARQGP